PPAPPPPPPPPGPPPPPPPPKAGFGGPAPPRLIPADELGPGAKEAGVAVFIDRQLDGDFGTMARDYRLGPWAEGTPQQGYQSRLTPQEAYRAAIAETDRRCEAASGKRFAALLPVQQERALRALDAGTPALEALPARLCFA